LHPARLSTRQEVWYKQKSGLCIYIPHRKGSPVIPPDISYPF
jgi:hypothetical protein